MARFKLYQLPLAASLIVNFAMGCHSKGPVRQAPTVGLPVARELEKGVLSEYRVEPPDILLIEAVRMVPKAPYKVDLLDILFIQVTPALPDDPISGLITVEPDGSVNLGESYGSVRGLQGLTLPEVKEKIEKYLIPIIKPKNNQLQATVSLSQTRAPQRISGPHLVRPDGTISLGTYGSVQVTGLTLSEIRQAVQTVLSATLQDPVVSVDVQNYNSKLFYVILDGGGLGQTVHRLPITGNETVMDAIAQMSGLTSVSSKDRIWVSRPVPSGECHQILPVDWRAVTELGDTATNYQLSPGDRVFVAAYPLVRVDNALARVISPIERVLGVTLLGTSVVNTIRFPPNQNFNNGFGR